MLKQERNTLRFNVPNEIPLVLPNGSNYDYHFIIKELANKFGGQFECFGEKTEKYKTFSVPIKKKIRKVDKDGNEDMITISYRIKFIGSTRFMESTLSNLVDNLAEGSYKIKCKDCNCILKYESAKDDLIKYKRLSRNKDYSNKIDEELKTWFRNTFKFSKNGINTFILLLRKGVYPYENMDDLGKFNETSLPQKEEFFSNLNMEEITDSDYIHAKRICKDFKTKSLCEYHDLHLKSNTLLLASVSENFRKMSLEIYQLDHAKVL